MARGAAFGLKRAPNSAVSPPDPPKPNPPLLSTPDFLLPLSGSRAQSISLLQAEVDGFFCSLVGMKSRRHGFSLGIEHVS